MYMDKSSVMNLNHIKALYTQTNTPTRISTKTISEHKCGMIIFLNVYSLSNQNLCIQTQFVCNSYNLPCFKMGRLVARVVKSVLDVCANTRSSVMSFDEKIDILIKNLTTVNNYVFLRSKKSQLSKYYMYAILPDRVKLCFQPINIHTSPFIALYVLIFY